LDKDKSLDFLPNRPVKIGEKLIPSQDAVLAVLGQKDDGNTKIDGVEFILKSFEHDKGFTTKIDAHTRLRSKLEGSIDVKPKDAEVTAVSLRGPLTILASRHPEIRRDCPHPRRRPSRRLGACGWTPNLPTCRSPSFPSVWWS
jgi:hypothetical protein